MKDKLQILLRHKVHPAMFAGSCLVLFLVVVMVMRSAGQIDASWDKALETVDTPLARP